MSLIVADFIIPNHAHGDQGVALYVADVKALHLSARHRKHVVLAHGHEFAVAYGLG